MKKLLFFNKTILERCVINEHEVPLLLSLRVFQCRSLIENSHCLMLYMAKRDRRFFFLMKVIDPQKKHQHNQNSFYSCFSTPASLLPWLGAAAASSWHFLAVLFFILSPEKTGDTHTASILTCTAWACCMQTSLYINICVFTGWVPHFASES